MIITKLWGHKLPSTVRINKPKPVARIGLGGTLETTTEKGRRIGRALGWGSFWAMIMVVATVWARWALLLMSFDLSSGYLGLQTALWISMGTLVVTSHVLVFICDYLTGGDAGPSAWALAIFWLGGLAAPILMEGFLRLF